MLTEELENETSEKNIDYSVVIINKILEFTPNSMGFKNILEQTIGFEEHIQVIFIDETPYLDISDEWKSIIEKYSDNIIYIETMDIHSITALDLFRYIKGKYFVYDWNEENYFRNAFAQMKKFTEIHEEETNVFCMKEDASLVLASKVVTNKEKNGIFVLFKNPDLFRLDGGSVVFPKRVLSYPEIKDIYLSDYFFLIVFQISCSLTMNLGIVNKSICRYSRDYAEYRYARMIALNNLGSYEEDVYDIYHKKIIEILFEKVKFCPLFFQNILCIDLAIRTAPKRIGLYAKLDEPKMYELVRSLRYILGNIEDEVILNCKVGFSENKANLLRFKYNAFPEITLNKNNVFLHYGNTMLQTMEDMAFNLDFLSMKDGMLRIEGQFLFFGLSDEDSENVKICASINGVDGHEFECCIRDSGSKYTIGCVMAQKCLWFKTSIYLSRLISDYEIEIYVYFKGTKIKKKINNISKFFPIDIHLDKSYFYEDNWKATFISNKLFVSYATEKDCQKAEKDFCNQIEKIGPNGKNAALVRKLYYIIKDLKTRPIWLFSNRLTAGGNNGGIFFNYVREKHPEIDSYFVLEENCDDYERLKSEGINVIKSGSIEHKLIYMLCDFNISSQFVHGIRNPFGEDDIVFFRDFKSREKFVYLQHGVIKDDMSFINQKRINNFYGHIVSAKAEYDSLENGIDFTEKNLWLTGLARFDALYHDEKKVICFSPTWRQWLMNSISPDGTRSPNMKLFKNSACYNFYQEILNNERLLESAEKYGYKLWFCDHPFLRAYDEEIYNFDSRVEIVNDMPSDELNAQTDLMITDYSSAVFDFVYLRKPVLYFQFDKNTFFQNHSFVGEGYFDYERDGFGEVEYDVDSAIDRIIEYIKSDCKLKDKYRKRIDTFFEFSDNNNCKRIYEHIIKSDAYREYPLHITEKSLLNLVNISQLKKIISKNGKISPLEALVQFDKEQKEKVKIKKEVQIKKEIQIVEKPVEIDYFSYVPERFYCGDLGLKAIWWCFKGWLKHKLKNKRNRNKDGLDHNSEE